MNGYMQRSGGDDSFTLGLQKEDSDVFAERACTTQSALAETLRLKSSFAATAK